MQRGVGALGGLLGIKPPVGVPDGSAGKPYHVIMDGGQSGGASGPFTPIGGPVASAGSGMPPLFSGGIGGMIFNMLPHMAGGGDISPSSAYIVGESGPELISGVSARVTGAAETSRVLRGGSSSLYQIDARGAALGVENRISRAMEMSHNAAVANSVRAGADRLRRTPVRAS